MARQRDCGKRKAKAGYFFINQVVGLFFLDGIHRALKKEEKVLFFDILIMSDLFHVVELS